MKIVTALAENAPKLIEAGIQLTIMLLQGIIQAIPTLLQAIWDLGSQLITYIWNGISSESGNFFTKIGELFSNIVTNLYNWGVEMNLKATEAMANLINGIVNWFKELPDQIWTWLVEIVTNLYNWGIDMNNKAREAIVKLVENVVNWFKELPGKVKTWLTQMVTNLYNWGIEMNNKARTAITNLVNNIINWFKELPNKVKETGKNIVEGLWKGIQNATTWIKNKVASFAKGILDGMKNALGIHSPSKEFAKLGNYSGLGFGEGFEKSLGSVYRDMQKAVEYENAKLTSNLTSTHQIQVQNEDNRQTRLESIDNEKEIQVNSTIKLDGKDVAKAVDKVKVKQKLQYGIA